MTPGVSGFSRTSPMRVLYLSPTASMGGAERVLLDLLHNLRVAQPTWALGLITANDGPLADDARRLGVITEVLPFPREFARIGDAGLTGPRTWARFARRAAGGSMATVRYFRALRTTIAAFEPDVIHSNGIKMHVLGALAKPERSALVWHFHDYLSARPVTCRVIKRLKHRCRAVVAVSESVAADLREQLGPGADVTTVWNSVDLTRFTPGGPRLDLDAMASLARTETGLPRIGLVATFARWKGHLLFLEALRLLKETRRFRGYIVGGPLYETDGSQHSLPELQAAITRLGLNGVVGLTGFVRDSDAALRHLDVVVHASTSPEPFGLVIAEAMACGRPVVVSRAGGVAELIEPEVNALTYTAGNSQELAAQLARLVDDVSLRRRIGDAARRSAVEQFDPQRVVGQMLGLYGRLPRVKAAA